MPRLLRPRRHLVLNTGNALEFVGVGLGCYGVDRLAGLSWAIVTAALALLVGAEFVYDAHLLRIPLPLRPRPLQRARRSIAMLRLRARSAMRRTQRFVRRQTAVGGVVVTATTNHGARLGARESA